MSIEHARRDVVPDLRDHVPSRDVHPYWNRNSCPRISPPPCPPLPSAAVGPRVCTFTYPEPLRMSAKTESTTVIVSSTKSPVKPVSVASLGGMNRFTTTPPLVPARPL